MKKLLLLTLFPLTTFITATIAGNAQQSGNFSFAAVKDSVIKDGVIKDSVIISNPRDGFKDLFESTAATTGFSVKLNPQALSFVQDYMDRCSERLNKMKSWGRPYFDMMADVLTKHGLPAELKYLSVIESDLKATAVSWAGAVGPWQLMPETARLMGLRVNRNSDERTDYTKSTHAAARYLTYLYGLYNDWLLVIAAYNGGPGNVNTAIRKSGSRNFWSMQYYLPAESRNHVKKFIATHYIMEGDGGATTLTQNERSELLLNQPATAMEGMEVISVSGKYNGTVIAQFLKMNMVDFSKLNPAFDKSLAANGTYNLRLPSDKALLFQAQKPQILEQSIRLTLSSAANF
ncbi:lytic transglycosylase domain-containing protein [Flavisolibacter tropicus]|uniref:Lytic transglycosylase n=1 Tax=Flavisolibacter tropicus TaxID=1492898 RepID=A0A172U0S5_9BACT|nr:lytic transglycosylase domain-containing protein [Flavisolibacter tropicus]ANE52597.1 lytic transglycosylase [Flavisolibacter tropicus]